MFLRAGEDMISLDMIFSAALEATKQALENVGIDHQLQCEIFKVGTVYLEISIDVGNSDERLKWKPSENLVLNMILLMLMSNRTSY